MCCAKPKEPSNLSATSLRTHLCGALRAEHVGQRVRLGGWVHRRRDLGGIVFIDLRDRAGLVQVAFGPGWCSPAVLQQASNLGSEEVRSGRKPAETSS